MRRRAFKSSPSDSEGGEQKAEVALDRSRLRLPLDSLKLGNHAVRALSDRGFMYVGDLIDATIFELRRISLDDGLISEIEEALAAWGLRLDMDIHWWPPNTPAESPAQQALSYDSNLLLRVDELDLNELTIHIMSTPGVLCSSRRNIAYVGDLIQMTRRELRTILASNDSLIGNGSLIDEIEEVLGAMGLRLDMDVASWPPKNVNVLAQRARRKG